MDNRIRLPGPKIDFNADVGITGQDHDNYPEPGQARYDHLRMFLIGLLAQQSSPNPPTEYRDGTPWVDTSSEPPTLKVNLAGQWLPYSDIIRVLELSLTDWCAAAQVQLDTLAPEVSFSGTATGTAAAIVVPTALQPALGSNSRPFVWINGLLLDPRTTALQGTNVSLSGTPLRNGDRFTVQIRALRSDYFHVPGVTAP